MNLSMNTKIKSIISIVVFSIAAIFFSVGFIWWTAAPYYQMTLWRNSMDAFRAGDDSGFPNDPAIYVHDTPAQGRMRLDAFSTLFNQYVNGTRKGYTPLYDQSLSRVEEWVNKHPVEYNFPLFLAKAYEYKGNLTGDASNYKIADEYYQKALALSPKRQEILYAYAEHLSNTGRKEEAIAILQEMRKTDPDIIQTVYYLGVVLAANDKDNYDQALAYLEEAFSYADTRPIPLDKVVIKTLYEHFFMYYYQRKDVERFSIAAHRLLSVDPSQKDAYTTIVNYLDAHHSIPLLNITVNS